MCIICRKQQTEVESNFLKGTREVEREHLCTRVELNTGTHAEATEDAAYWLAAHDLLGLISLFLSFFFFYFLFDRALCVALTVLELTL